jgi:ubiquinone/menaquinone biosynthesis C-methylase UbiE
MQAIQPEIQQTPDSFLLEKRVADYWDERSAAFSRKRRRELDGPNGMAWRRLITAYLDQHFATVDGLRVLDAGTGAGFFAILLAEMGARVTGIDMSREMVHAAKANSLAYGVSGETHFTSMNAQELTFADHTFDLVISRNLTWTLPDVMQAYREWTRVLKPGGLLLNFDSDLRGVVWDEQNTGDHLGMEKLAECTALKDAMRINTHARPAWDQEFLEQLGMQVWTRDNISPLVQIDPTLPFDRAPLFALCASKKA